MRRGIEHACEQTSAGVGYIEAFVPKGYAVGADWIVFGIAARQPIMLEPYLRLVPVVRNAPDSTQRRVADKEVTLLSESQTVGQSDFLAAR